MGLQAATVFFLWWKSFKLGTCRWNFVLWMLAGTDPKLQFILKSLVELYNRMFYLCTIVQKHWINILPRWYKTWSLHFGQWFHNKPPGLKINDFTNSWNKWFCSHSSKIQNTSFAVTGKLMCIEFQKNF